MDQGSDPAYDCSASYEIFFFFFCQYVTVYLLVAGVWAVMDCACWIVHSFPGLFSEC